MCRGASFQVADNLAETRDISTLRIPDDLKPRDGRFGSGPSKTRNASLEALIKSSTSYLGTSHRQSTVKSQVGRVRQGLKELFGLDDGYEIVLGNGGSTAFWEIAVCGLIERRSQHLVFGEFSSKFAQSAKACPHIEDPQIIESPVGAHPFAVAADDIDVYALTHNETSTGVSMEIARPDGATGLVVVDATSAAGGLRFRPSECDVYYSAPQKCFGGDGGLWLSAMSPAAIERANKLCKDSRRWVPAFLDLSIAIENSLVDQTYNTPSLTTILMLAEQVDWMNQNGGMSFSSGRCDRSAEILYTWAQSSKYATPFVSDPAMRSHVVGTIDFDDSIDASQIAKVLRSNGIVDTEPYRKLGRNQLRIAMFPNVDPEDIELLTQAIDWVAERL